MDATITDFRELLAETTVPENKKKFRDIQGRDGHVIFNKNGDIVARQYKLETSQHMLRELLKAQKLVQREGPNPHMTLISEEELHEIRRLWRIEHQSG